MTEAKGCFLLVSVGRPSVSLPTTEGGTRRMEEGGKKRWQRRGSEGDVKEDTRKKLTVIQQNSHRERQGSRQTEKWVNYLIQCWEFALQRKYLQCSMGNVERVYFRLCSCLLCQAASRARVKLLQCCKYINMWGRKRRRRRGGGGVVSLRGGKWPRCTNVPSLVFALS